MLLTIKVTGVILGFQLWDKLCLLPQQAVPVQVVEKLMLLHLSGSSYTRNNATQINKPAKQITATCSKYQPLVTGGEKTLTR